MLSAIKMRKGHFLKDLKTFGQTGLLKYIQGTMAEFKSKLDLFKNVPAGVCCACVFIFLAFVIFTLFFLSLGW